MTTIVTSSITCERPDLKILTTTASGGTTTTPVASGQIFILPQTVEKGGSLRNWKSLISRGMSATTYLHGSRRNYSFPTGTATRLDIVTTGSQKGKVRRRILVGAIEGTTSAPGVSTALLNETTLAARKIFLKRAIKAQRKIQSLVTLGEIGQTARMIKNMASLLHHGIWDYLAALKKRRKRSKRDKKTHEIISEAWLEYSFGWQPLMNDIDDAAHALAEATVNASKEFERINSNAGRTSFTPGVVSIVGAPGIPGPFLIHKRATTKATCSVRFSGAVNLQPPGTNEVTNQFGLRLRDIVPSLWELVPYSFLVDYFTNIGDMIEGACFQRSDLRWVEYGWSHESENTIVVDSIEFPPLVGESLSESHYQVSEPQRLTSTTVHREQDSGTFVPPLQFEIPGLRSKKWLNIAALVGASRRTSRELSAY